jgi:hypothetical protein
VKDTINNGLKKVNGDKIQRQNDHWL